MKRFENIVQSETAPNTNSLWIKDNVLKYFNNGQWVPLSYQENGSNNNGVIDNLKEILDFLEGFDDDGTLKDFIEFQITDIRNRLNAYGDPKYIESVRLATQYSSEPIDITKDFAVIMNDGSLYIERNIDWSKKVVDFWGKKAIDLHTDRNLFSSEYAPKFSKILSLGDLSPADGINMYALWHIKLPYCYPWGRPKVLGLIKSDIPEGSNLSEDYLEYQMHTVKIPPKFNFTYNGPSNSFEFLNCDFTECEYATDTLDYEEGDICSVHLNLPVDGKGAIRFYGSKFDNLYTINCKNIDKITNYQTLMFNNCEIKNFPAFYYPRGEAGNHIMDPENPTATHTNHPWCNNWKFTSLTDANSLFTGLKYVGPDPDKLIMDFSVFNFVNATGAWRCYAELGNMPHIQIYHPKLANPAYDIFHKDDKTKTLIITEVGPNCNAVWGGLPLALEHIEMNLRNAANFGTSNDIYTAKILLLYHLKCDCNISNFPLIGDDSVERTLTYLQTVTNKTFTLNTNVYNRIIKQDKFKELIAAAEAKGWTITHATTEAADKVYNAKYDNITSRLSNVEEGITNLTTQVDSIEPYTLPVATTTTLGGVKSSIGDYSDDASSYDCLNIDSLGKIRLIASDYFIVNMTNASSFEYNFRAEPVTTTKSGFNIKFRLNSFDGSRTLTTANNFVIEKGLKKVLESYLKLTDGRVPAQYLPSFVDDVQEFPVLEAFPTPGETGKIYVDTAENRTYRWSGTQYTEIGKSLALGETSSTAYAGDKGAANAAKVINLEENLNKAISDLSNLTDAVEGLSTTVDGIQPDTLPTNSDFITALVTQLKNNSEFKAAVKQIMAENTAPTNEGQ